MPVSKKVAKVTVDMSADGFMLKPALSSGKKIELPYSERELLEDITPAKAHADALAMPADFEMGADARVLIWAGC